MMFVELELVSGRKVYVNADYIRYIANDCDDGVCVVSVVGAEFCVKGDPKDIVHDIRIDANLSKFGL